MKKSVYRWLFLGLVLVYVQIILGGITRLTGSGLSITKWEIVTGTIPPITQEDWMEVFDLYKSTPQYQKINQGMTLNQFKYIYFWEYLHRLWARAMGFIFIFPFIFFMAKKWLPVGLVRRLGIVILLAGMAASFGWVMVASGLVNRPWVNAYKLAVHLMLAVILIGFLMWTTLDYRFGVEGRYFRSGLLRWVFFLLIAQIILGGLMSGMKAALVYPTFPDFDGHWLPEVLMSAESWDVNNFVRYDRSAFVPAIVQLLHRTVGYLLFILGLWVFFLENRAWRSRGLFVSAFLWPILLVSQVLLGIIVLINSKTHIPTTLGVLHQGLAIALFLLCIYLVYFDRKGGLTEIPGHEVELQDLANR